MVSLLKTRYTFLLFSLFILIFFSFNHFANVQIYINTIFTTITYPFLRLQKAITAPIISWKQKRMHAAQLETFIELLKKEREELLAENIVLQAKFDFMQNTKELITFQKRYTTYQKELAQILLRQLSNQGHFFIVDKGSWHGIEPDMIAVYKNCLVGRVAEVFPWYSKILLITDQSCKVAVFCAKTKTQGIYEGINNKESAVLSHVSHLEKMQKNDLVISSGQGLVFPRGFGLGKIKEFSVDGVYYSIQLIPLLDLQNLSYCYLMKKSV